MLIERFFLPAEEACKYGLAEINIARLGNFVVLAGKNGAGKSRILNALSDSIQNRNNVWPNLSKIQAQIKSYEDALKTNPTNSSAPDWKQGIINFHRQIDQATSRVYSGHEQIGTARFVPKNMNFIDPRNESAAQLIGKFNAAARRDLTSYAELAFSYIQQLSNRYWNARHQDYSGEDRNETLDDYKKFEKILAALLDAKIERDVDGQVHIFSMPLHESNLSDGQKILIQMVVALHSQNANLGDTVFLMDELENHLHPSVTIDILSRIQDVAPQAQIWIATHSLPLIAYVCSRDPMALWYVNDGKVSHAGRHPQRVLESLLGDEERISQLRNLTSLPAVLALVNYAVESLLDPKVVEHGSNDPQVLQIAQVLTEKSQGRPLAVLDFGAGKGRLLDGIATELGSENLRNTVSYFAFDKFSSSATICRNLIAQHYDGEAARYFSSEDTFFAEKSDGSIDVVVMCNVFHEIDPREWLPLFSPSSLIMRSLADDGFLLLVEDQCIPVGERAHDYGFLVLDRSHLKTLFRATEEQMASFITAVSPSNSRLKAHLIPKKVLRQITTESRKDAIEQLAETALRAINAIRASAPTYSNGQQHGFWCQQFTNASIFLKQESH